MKKIKLLVVDDNDDFINNVKQTYLTDEEVEEYLQEFPEFRKYWKT